MSKSSWLSCRFDWRKGNSALSHSSTLAPLPLTPFRKQLLVMQMVMPRNCGVLDIPYSALVAVVHPHSRFHKKWDVQMLLVIMAVSIVTPFTICFEVKVERTSLLGAFQLQHFSYCSRGTYALAAMPLSNASDLHTAPAGLQGGGNVSWTHCSPQICS